MRHEYKVTCIGFGMKPMHLYFCTRREAEDTMYLTANAGVKKDDAFTLWTYILERLDGSEPTEYYNSLMRKREHFSKKGRD